MDKKFRFATVGATVLLAGSAALLGAVTAPPAWAQARGAARTDAVEMRATVESIDQGSRTVLLREEDGSLATVKVSPNVRNLPQVKAGDTVVLQYGETLIAQAVASGAPAGRPTAEAMTARAPKGAMPGGLLQDAVTVRVTVTAIDLSHNMVSFTGPGGASHTVPVRHPDMQRLLRSLKVGDQVDVTYERALAVRVIRG